MLIVKSKILLVTGILFFFTWITSAQTRSIEEAMSISQVFLQNKDQFRSSSVETLSVAYTAKRLLTSVNDPEKLFFYVLNCAENKGFIIVSADCRSKDILGYAAEGNFDYNRLPENFLSWLEFYEKEIESLDNPVTSAHEQSISTSFPTSVDPLLSTLWHQSSPYNNKCPGSCPTGCVATAMAQIMYYHKYPDHGTGSRRYRTQTNYYDVSVDFGATTYDWTQMCATYTGNETTIQKNAVATLMLHCGAAVRMDYAMSGSAANLSELPYGLTKYFGYSDHMEICSKDQYTYEGWANLLKADLVASRPVFYRGDGTGGHAFVCDGYNDHFFHFNWFLVMLFILYRCRISQNVAWAVHFFFFLTPFGINKK